MAIKSGDAISANWITPGTDFTVKLNNGGTTLTFQSYSGNNGQKIWGSTHNGLVFEGTAAAYSSVDYKTAIYPLDDITNLLKLKPIVFKYKNESVNKNPHYGLLWEETISLIPNICYNDGQSKTINYVEIVPLLIKGYQNQQKTLTNLEERVSKLEEGARARLTNYIILWMKEVI